ncbi:MAG: hypothetical protein K0S70_472 [Microbacterium sp.]|jgi:hypothetical protein|nr:hypothetical protein [Microbacterium sp.]
MQYEDLTDGEVMRLLATTTGRKQNSIIRDIERRTERALKAVTRDYVDPEAARNAAVYEVTTPQGIEKFLASEKKTLSAWTATIAARRIGQDAGLVGEGARTDAMYSAGSWDQRLEERGDAAYDGAVTPVPQSDEGLKNAVTRMGFERITGPQPDGREPLTEKHRVRRRSLAEWAATRRRRACRVLPRRRCGMSAKSCHDCGDWDCDAAVTTPGIAAEDFGPAPWSLVVGFKNRRAVLVADLAARGWLGIGAGDESEAGR